MSRRALEFVQQSQSTPRRTRQHHARRRRHLHALVPERSRRSSVMEPFGDDKLRHYVRRLGGLFPSAWDLEAANDQLPAVGGTV